MRVLHLSDRLTERGGAGWHARAVLERLRALGHELHLAAGAADAGTAAPCPTTLVAGLDARHRVPVALDSLVAAFRPDVVHLHTVVNPAVLDWAAEERALITVQDHRYFCPGRGKVMAGGEPCRQPIGEAPCAECFDDEPYHREVRALTEERLRALRGLRVVVLSRYMQGELVAAGVPAARITVVPPFVHGLDPEAPPDGPPCVLFAGRLAEAKGVHDAVAAWRRAAVGLPLVFAGTGPLRAALEAGGHDVLGWLPHALLAALYRRARALVMPPRWQEPFGIVGLEALAMGTPVAAWRSGGVAEWHPGDRTLVEWGDVDGLAAALRHALEGPRAVLPAGFEADGLMRRLLAVYEAAARG